MNNPARPAELVDYPAIFSLPIQWGDQDLFGHVNNVVYFRWYESARLAYLEQSGLEDLLLHFGLGPILAAAHCDYRRQLLYPDTITIGARITRVGRASLTMRHAIFSPRHQAIAAEGESVVVAFNYQTQKSHPLPDEVRTAIERFEGRTPSP